MLRIRVAKSRGEIKAISKTVY